MATPAKHPIEESLVAIYEEHFLTHADMVYRLAFALTLSLDGARHFVGETYKAIAANLPKYVDTAEGGASGILIETCWRVFNEHKGNAFSGGQSAVAKALQPLATSARAALVAIDVAGLDAASAARVLQISDKDLRVHLAHARRTLLSSSVQL